MLPAVLTLIRAAQPIHFNGRDAFLIEKEDLGGLEDAVREYEKSLEQKVEIKYEQEQTNRS